MTPRRRRRMLLVVVILAGAGITTALTLYALQQNVNLFYSTSQIAAGEAPGDRVIRVGGLVVDGSVQRNPETLKVAFDLSDGAEAITVEYQGILPDLFREGQGIVARGQLVGDRRVLASEVLAKHDENYMPPEVADSMKASMPEGHLPTTPAN